jgi:hypothetical protein
MIVDTKYLVLLDGTDPIVGMDMVIDKRNLVLNCFNNRVKLFNLEMGCTL